MSRFRVVICGAGIAGIEALLRLRRLAGDRVDVTVVSPDEQFVYRPLAVFEPFGIGAVCRYPLRRIVSDLDAAWIRDGLHSVDGGSRRIQTADGQELAYDALLLAVGARESAPFAHGLVFSDRADGAALRAVINALDAGAVSRLAFVVPNWPVWPVPLYELALMMAERAKRAHREVQITFLTPAPRPLKSFGQAAADAIVSRFTRAGIDLRTGAVAHVPAPDLVRCANTDVPADAIITLPRITGPAIAGVGAGENWFVPIDERCVVEGSDGRVFAAGDATDFPVKHGGIAAQQADTAAAGIAHLAGVGERPAPLAPVIRATVFTGDRALSLKARVVHGLGWHSTVCERTRTPDHEKVRTEELGPYLAALRNTTDVVGGGAAQPVSATAGADNPA